MLNYTIRRLLLLIPTLFGITVVTFVIINLAPGDPVELINRGEMDARISPAAYHQMLHLYGLDEPMYVRYFTWLKRVGTPSTHLPTTAPHPEKIVERLPATLAQHCIVSSRCCWSPVSCTREASVLRFDKLGNCALPAVFAAGVLGGPPAHHVPGCEAQDPAHQRHESIDARHRVSSAICRTGRCT
jgi:hypothetical protein